MAPNQSIVVRPLSAIANAITRMGRNGNGKKDDLSSYFGPGLTVPPIAPPDTPVRGFQYWPFLNQTFLPRPDAKYSAQQLRALALYPLARICIENSKDVICGLPRQIRAVKKPGEKNSDVDKRSQNDPNLKMLNEFFDCPDGEHMWDEWLRPYLEDMFVIDAACMVVEHTKGKPSILRYKDGASIHCVIDVRGVVVGYQDLWSGSPATQGGIPFVDLTKDQLIYRPRNIVPRNTVSSYLYGMPPTEQLATEIQIGAARQGFILSYYTDGEIPDGIHIVPPGISGDQLRATQKAMESELTGLANLYKRHHILLHQGFVDRTQVGGTSGDQLIFPKAALLENPEAEDHIRKIAFGYGTPTQRLLKAMNRASAQVNQEAAEEEGYMPYAVSVKKGLVDWTIAKLFDFGFGVYELTYDTQRELDAVKRAQADKSDVESGIITYKEARVNRGIDADPAPDMGELMITTKTGTVPVDLDAQVKQAKAMAAAQPKPQPAGGGNGNSKKVEKRATARIDPARETHDTRQARARLEGALARVFMRQKERAAQEAHRVLKVKKADDPEKKADEIYAAIEMEFRSLPAEARESLEQAAKAGIAQALVELEVTDGGMLSSVNRIAAEYASKRAAELVGMRYDDAGELVANPNAKYAISDTTRERLREIIKNAFEEKTPFSEVISDIENADIFSQKRAELIARTEVSQAQIGSNFKVWKESGLVKSVKWLSVGPDPCPICLANDSLVRKIGEEFPSGDKYPTAHPACYCILIPAEFNE